MNFFLTCLCIVLLYSCGERVNVRVSTAPITIPSTPATVAIGIIPNGFTSSPTFNISHDGNAATFEAKILRASDDYLVKDWTSFPQGGQVSGLTLYPGIPYYAVVRGVNRLGVSGEATTDVWLPNTQGCLGSMMTNTPFAGGTGAKNDPYLICTKTQFLAIASSTSYLTKSFSLLTDVDLTGETFGGFGSAANPFSGQFFGNNKIVSSFSVNDSARDEVGLFRVMANAMIMDLNLNDFSVTGKNKLGGVAGQCIAGFIKNVRVNSLQFTGGDSIGGVVGDAQDCTLIELSTSGTILSVSSGGGLIGASFGSSVLNAISTVTVTGTSGNTGGAIGMSFSPVDHLFSAYQNIKVEADVKGSFASGGLVGSMMDALKFFRSSYEGSIEGMMMTGGAFGQMDGAGGGCEIRSISTKYSMIGSFISGGLAGEGKDDCVVSDIRTEGVIDLPNPGSASAGGFFGQIDLEGSFNYGLAITTINSTGSYIGGGVGAINGGTISNSAVIADVSANSGNISSLFTGLLDLLVSPNPSSFYWSGGSCTTQDLTPCNTSDGTARASLASFHDSTLAPFNVWNFTRIWQTNAGTYPSLRESQVSAPTVSHTCSQQALVDLPYTCELNIVDADINETQFASLEPSHACDWLMPRGRNLAGAPALNQLGSCEANFTVTDGTFSSSVQTLLVTAFNEISLTSYMDAFDFFSQSISGGPSNSSITLTNNTAAPLNFTITGFSEGSFSLVGTSCGTTLTASGSCTLNLSFDPSTVGNHRDSLFVNYLSGATPVSIQYRLKGEGI